MGDDADMRATDKRLFQLCEKFDEHVERFEKHEQRETQKFDKLFKAQESNTKAVTTLTESVTLLVDDTKDIVQLHKNFQGAAAIGNGVQGFMLWLLKWGMIGAGMVAIIKWTIKHFS